MKLRMEAHASKSQLLRSQRQEECQLKASLNNTARPCVKNNKNTCGVWKWCGRCDAPRADPPEKTASVSGDLPDDTRHSSACDLG